MWSSIFVTSELTNKRFNGSHAQSKLSFLLLNYYQKNKKTQYYLTICKRIKNILNLFAFRVNVKLFPIKKNGFTFIYITSIYCNMVNMRFIECVVLASSNYVWHKILYPKIYLIVSFLLRRCPFIQLFTTPADDIPSIWISQKLFLYKS